MRLRPSQVHSQRVTFAECRLRKASPLRPQPRNHASLVADSATCRSSFAWPRTQQLVPGPHSLAPGDKARVCRLLCPSPDGTEIVSPPSVSGCSCRRERNAKSDAGGKTREKVDLTISPIIDTFSPRTMNTPRDTSANKASGSCTKMRSMVSWSTMLAEWSGHYSLGNEELPNTLGTLVGFSSPNWSQVRSTPIIFRPSRSTNMSFSVSAQEEGRRRSTAAPSFLRLCGVRAYCLSSLIIELQS